MPKDDVLTLKLPGDNLVFTRYLYIKDEVKTALLTNILNKSDDAIFWAYELYYSGFKNELYAFIWQIYYDFFATLNPSFAVYLSKKLSNKQSVGPKQTVGPKQSVGPKQDLIEDRLISSIIQNLLIRSFNTDVFLLRTISEVFILSEAKEEEDSEAAVEEMLETKSYRELASYILNNKDLEIEETYKTVLNYFKLTNQQKLAKDLLNEIRNTHVSKRVILLANIVSLFNTEAQKLVKKKNFYVRVDPEEVVQYETIEATDNLKAYRVLPQACSQKIQHDWSNLFHRFRNQPSEKEKYNEWTNRAAVEKYSDNWLYHAAFSPEWFARIKSCKGYVDYQNQQVKFVSEDWEEAFYSKYGYDPDEQPLFVKENTLKLIKSDNVSTWQQFFAKYKKDGVINALDEELDALNEEPLKY
jgi:hypothetical protein